MIQCNRCGKLLKGTPDGNPHYCKRCLPIMQQAEEGRKRADLRKEERNREYAAWMDYLPIQEVVIPDVPYKRQQGYEPFNFSNITPSGDYSEIVVFDTETTGLAPSRDRIIEIAAVRFIDGSPVEKYHSFVNPERPIPPEVTEINHITDDMVEGAPTIGEILPSFDEFIGKSILVAHNLEFDLKFIFYSGSHVFDVKRKYIDTLEQARRFIKNSEIDNYKLGTLCDHFNIPIINAHSALADAFVTGMLFYRLVNIKNAINIVSGPPKEVLSSKSLISLMETTTDRDGQDPLPESTYQSDVQDPVERKPILNKGVKLFVLFAAILLICLYIGARL